MNSLLEGLSQALGLWWWFGCDGQTKAANIGDDWVLPIFIAVSLCMTAVLAWWCYR